MEPLSGTISYHLDLVSLLNNNNNNNNTTKRNKKRARNEDTSTATTTTTRTRRTSDAIAGWILHPYNYSLSVPQKLLVTVSNACRFNATVTIRQYQLLKLPIIQNDINNNSDNHVDDNNNDNNDNDNNNPHLPRIVVEVLDMEPLLNSFQSESISEDIDFWTLEQIARREAMDRIENYNPKNATYYNLVGYVQSISPVIALDPNDPFALMILLEQKKTITTHDTKQQQQQQSSSSSLDCQLFSCIVVLRDLKLMEAIQPNQIVKLHQVKRQKWKIPTVLEQMMIQDDQQQQQLKEEEEEKEEESQSISDYVFVVNDANRQVILEDQFHSPSSLSNTGTNKLTARIKSVHYLQLDQSAKGKFANKNTKQRQQQHHQQQQQQQQQHVIHYLELSVVSSSSTTFVDDIATTANHHHRTKQKDVVVILFVTYFPMASALQLSLRAGAMIQATNIHKLQHVHYDSPNDSSSYDYYYDYYCADLQSHIVITSMGTTTVSTAIANSSSSAAAAPKSYESNSYSTTIKPPTTTMEINQIYHPYLFLTKLRPTYWEFSLRQNIRRNLLSDFSSSTTTRTTTEEESSLVVVPPKMSSSSSSSSQHDLAAAAASSLLQSLYPCSSCGDCCCRTNPLNIPNKDTRKKTSTRNPYSEFFFSSNQKYRPACFYGDDKKMNKQDTSTDSDRVVDDSETESSLGRNKQNSCSAKTWPVLMSLSQIQKLSIQEISKRLKKLLTSKSEQHPILHVGWTGSFLLSNDLLSSFMNGMTQNKELYTIGIVKKSDRNHPDSKKSSLAATISNDHFILPIALIMTKFDHESNEHNNELNSKNDSGQLSWAHVWNISCSCICIGKNNNATTTIVKSTMQELPSSLSNKEKKNGPCTVMTLNGYVFLSTFFLECSRIRPVASVKSLKKKESDTPATTTTMTKNSSNGRSTVMLSAKPLTIETCLASPCTVKKTTDQISNHYFSGVLTRKFFKGNKKIKNGQFDGFMIVLANSSTCTIQSLEFKPQVEIKSNAPLLLSLKAPELLSIKNGILVSEEQLHLACVWWKLANSETTCAMLGGGLDEVVSRRGSWKDMNNHKKRGIVVCVPVSALQCDEKRGYVRVRCEVDDLISSVQYFENTETTSQSYTNDDCEGKHDNPFEHIGYKRFLPGMLDRWPKRRCYKQIAHGELLAVPHDQSGIPACYLADLNKAVCQSLVCRSQIRFSPSLVCAVRGTFLGVSYCRAIAECTKCFSVLKIRSPAIQQDAKEKVDSSLQSYWHLPRPAMQDGLQKDSGNDDSKNDQINPKSFLTRNGTDIQGRQFPSNIRCPNNCRVNEHAAIKWECSGTLDDGTGQAILYAERDVALCLLGLPKSAVSYIEEGAWLDANGIIFSQTMPPKAIIREAVLKAKGMASQEHKRCRLQDNDILTLLNPDIRAEYLMQRHCRSSLQPTREQVYFVRCKPLSDNAFHLNHTEIEGVPSTPTYSSPPLKLNLVDCANKQFFLTATGAGDIS